MSVTHKYDFYLHRLESTRSYMKDNDLNDGRSNTEHFQPELGLNLTVNKRKRPSTKKI